MIQQRLPNYVKQNTDVWRDVNWCSVKKKIPGKNKKILKLNSNLAYLSAV
jgi:hypothetical protein